MKCAAGAVVEANGWVGREGAQNMTKAAEGGQEHGKAAGRAPRRLKLLEEAAEEERGAREAVAGVPESEVSREMIRIRHAIWSDPLKWDENGNQRGGARVGLETLTWEAARQHVHNRIHGKGLDLIGGVIEGAGGRRWCVVAVVADSAAGGRGYGVGDRHGGAVWNMQSAASKR